MPDDSTFSPAWGVAAESATALDALGIDYAVGGALAYGIWTEPRATRDVGVTLFLDPRQPESVLRLLSEIGCTFQSNAAQNSLYEFGFCRAYYRRCFVDLFLPTTTFLNSAKHRRSFAQVSGRDVRFWNAEVVCVLKLLFFREKDVVDLKDLIWVQGAKLDRDWVRERIIEVCGQHDPRRITWDELLKEVDEYGPE